MGGSTPADNTTSSIATFVTVTVQPQLTSDRSVARLVFAGTNEATLGGVLSLVFTNGPYANGTDVLRLFANSGTLTGSFSSVQVSGLDAGQFATFNAATGYVTIVPEPAGCVAAVLGLSALWGMRRRSGHAAPRGRHLPR